MEIGVGADTQAVLEVAVAEGHKLMSTPGIGPRRLQQIQAHEKVRRLMQIPSNSLHLGSESAVESSDTINFPNATVCDTIMYLSISCVFKLRCLQHPGHSENC